MNFNVRKKGKWAVMERKGKKIFRIGTWEDYKGSVIEIEIRKAKIKKIIDKINGFNK